MLFLDLECYSQILGNFFAIIKNILFLVQIIGPILCIVSLTLSFITIMTNPDDKKAPGRIKNSAIALVLLFFIPLLVNVVMGLVSDNSQVSACWKNATINNDKPSYIDPYESGEKKKINSSGDYEKSTSTSKSSSSVVVFLGDSRTVQMYAYNSGVWSGINYSESGVHTVGNDVYIAQGSMGLDWMKNTGISAASSYLNSGAALVILMGVNDLYNASNYVSYINSNVSSWSTKGSKVYFVSVNPCDGGYSHLNSQINSFNNTLKSGLSKNVKYIDTNSSLSFTTTDGLHYNESTSKGIYNYIKRYV